MRKWAVADRKKFSHSFDGAKKQREQVVVHFGEILLKWLLRCPRFQDQSRLLLSP
jgi:hypothetical protein